MSVSPIFCFISFAFLVLLSDASRNCVIFYYLRELLSKHNLSEMPKVRRSRKSPPEGWELIEPTLEELEQKMREG